MKFISVSLIFFLLSYHLGCHSTNVIKRESEFRDPLQRRDPVSIKTTSGNEYFFEAKSYKIENDTLHGEGQEVIGLDLMQEPKPVRVAYHDIKEIKQKKWDITYTMVGAIFLAGVLYWHLYWSRVESP